MNEKQQNWSALAERERELAAKARWRARCRSSYSAAKYWREETKRHERRTEYFLDGMMPPTDLRP